ncbi:RluA family pseudouridine synthase [Faecalicoccus pleomorphus]|uniref:RluA family pseudouridine synthase n=1 Tax=Faecalicoccus pleomorphus TaxID=1323 RepID=UPI0026F0D039|nr:RluA family pseudouridine synthase [Faecalicoccus pleomorphus]
MENIVYTIDEKNQGCRLDKFVSTTMELSRKRVRDLLDQNQIQVNGKVEKASYSLQIQDQVSITLPPLQEVTIEPEAMNLDILYEDSDLLVINKPKGLVVHPAPGHTSNTLVNGLLCHCKDLSGINGEMRPGIVHRIDKDTSGLLIVCKNDKAHQAISQQLSDKTCHRDYLAIVHHPFSHSHGTINAPIGRDEKDRQKMAVTAKNSKDAVTHFTVLKNFKDFAYIRCSLETGRTHQIRVHMQYIGHPIAGDPKYSYKKTLDTNGQLLYACHIEFIHPTTKEKMAFDAPLDPTFKEILGRLEREESV